MLYSNFKKVFQFEIRKNLYLRKFLLVTKNFPKTKFISTRLICYDFGLHCHLYCTLIRQVEEERAGWLSHAWTSP